MKKAFATSQAAALVVAASAVVSACGTSDASPFMSTTPSGDGGTQTAGDSAPSSVPGIESGSAADSNSAADSGSGSAADSGNVPSLDSGTAAETGSTSDGGTECGTTPKRYVVLGHSVAHCYAVGGPTSETCAFKSLETYMATKFPGLVYENYAVDGALIADVLNNELPMVKGGAGHVFVNLYIGGNDLAAHLYELDAQAQQSWQNLKPQAIANLNSIHAFFEDTAKFPDGATVLVNTQYNPFDECVAGIYSFASLSKQGIIKEFNGILGTIAQAHTRSYVVDQYSSFLGHGHNFDQSQCPKYITGAADWMADIIHPNAAGHVSLSKQMTAAVDGIFKCP